MVSPLFTGMNGVDEFLCIPLGTQCINPIEDTPTPPFLCLLGLSQGLDLILTLSCFLVLVFVFICVCAYVSTCAHVMSMKVLLQARGES